MIILLEILAGPLSLFRNLPPLRFLFSLVLAAIPARRVAGAGNPARRRTANVLFIQTVGSRVGLKQIVQFSEHLLEFLLELGKTLAALGLQQMLVAVRVLETGLVSEKVSHESYQTRHLARDQLHRKLVVVRQRRAKRARTGAALKLGQSVP